MNFEFDLEIFLPIYNEEKVILESIATVREFSKNHPQYCFTFVDDGSEDKTPDLLRDNINNKRGDSLRYRLNPVNRGKGYALTRCLCRPRANKVAFTDGDLAYSMDHLLLIESELEDHDIVIGSRDIVLRKENGKPTVRRTLLHNGLILVVRLFLGVHHRDTQSGLKGFKREVAEKIFNMNEIHAYGFDIEVLFLAKKLGFSVKEIPATVSTMHTYKLDRSTLIKHSIRAFYDLVRIRINDWLGIYESK